MRVKTSELVAGLAPEDFFIQSTTDTSPVKWHLAHTNWFFDRFVLEKLGLKTSLSTDYDYLFNSYYQSVGAFKEKVLRHHILRPTLKEVLEWRLEVETRLQRIFNGGGLDENLSILFETGIHHEQQHQELILMDLKRAYFNQSSNCFYSPTKKASVARNVGIVHQAHYARFEEAFYNLGWALESFAYDNERPAHKEYVRAFEISDSLVTNAEFLEFINHGGYHKPEYWLSDGWDWKSKNNIVSPLYWNLENESARQYRFTDNELINLHQPVCHISFYEADAFARWRSERLPTEFEWEVYSQTRQSETQNLELNFLESNSFHPVRDNLEGQVWQWTSSPYSPYPGYVSFREELAEYNSKFMCNQFILRGGSIWTPGSHYRNTYRNFYYPHQRWMMSGFRLARDL